MYTEGENQPFLMNDFSGQILQIFEMLYQMHDNSHDWIAAIPFTPWNNPLYTYIVRDKFENLHVQVLNNSIIIALVFQPHFYK